MAVQQHVLNWLYSVLTSEYQNVNRTYNDVAQALSQYPSLSPRTDVHTFPNGASALLLHLSGTIPVVFRGTTYRFPVSIWVPHTYPRESPLVYVTPTENMMVRPGQHVDPQGQVYHHYLVQWETYWDKSSMLDLLDILRDVFSKEPPVMSKKQVMPPLMQQPPPSPPPVPPFPPDLASRTAVPATPSPVPGNVSRPPPPPPKPGAPAKGPISQPPTSPFRPSTGPPVPPLPPGMPRPTGQYGSPPPPMPQQLPQPFPQQSQSQLQLQSQPQPLPQLGPSHNNAGPPLHLPPAASYQHESQAQTFLQHTQSRVGGVQPGPPYAPFPPTDARHESTFAQTQHMGPPQQSWQPQPHQQHQQPFALAQPQPVSKPPPPTDLMDDDLNLIIPSPTSVAAPPIPPNPEKDMLLQHLGKTLYSLRQKAREQHKSSLAGLQAQRSAMLQAQSAIQADLSQLLQLSGLLASNQTILQESIRKANVTIENSAQHPAPAIDEFLVAQTVVGNQLYELVAEERALEDTIFVLGRAVERGRIAPHLFAKTVRSLAREWYLKKALVRKIGVGMDLM